MKLGPLFCALGAVSVGVLSAQAQFVWTDLNGTDSFSDGLNWLPTVPPTNGSTLLFGVAGVPNVVLDENFSASTITFDTFAYDITHFSGTLTITNGIVYSALDTGTTFINVPISISSVISILNTSLTGALELEGVGGTGGFTLTGVGNTLLGGTNTYSGNTRVTSGTLADASADALSPNSLYQVVSGGHLIVNANENVSGLSDNGGAGGTVAVASGAVLMMTGTASTTFSGVISGLGGVEKDGLGTFTLTGANTYSGGTAITGANLSVGDGATVGARITGNVADAGTLTFAPALADGYTFAGTISGSGAVTFAGPGSITLSGPNAYLGMTSVNAGTLSDGVAGSFSPGSRMLVNSSGGSLAVNFNETVADLENGGTGGPVSIASGAVLTSLGSVYGGDFKGAVSGAGKFSVSA
ncbi:MAG TPA: autotransporter-associated beta strand repeat-containing protein, partial [Opitutaceae bacterium]